MIKTQSQTFIYIAKMTTLRRLLTAKSYYRIPLRILKSNHFAIVVTINNVPGVFILDSGASATCIDFKKADKFKLISSSTAIKAVGAGSSDLHTAVSKSNAIKMDEWTKNRINIVLMDLSHVNSALLSHNQIEVDGILGADVLKKGKAILDYPNKCLYLK